jgi:hypothetical protein
VTKADGARRLVPPNPSIGEVGEERARACGSSIRDDRGRPPDERTTKKAYWHTGL